MFRSAMSARARRGAHCAPERPRSGTRPNVQRISLPNARVAAVEKACARTQAQPKRASGAGAQAGGVRAGAEGGRGGWGRCGRTRGAAGGWGAAGADRSTMPSTVVENAPNVCAGKNTGQNASECVPESARHAQQTAYAMHLPVILSNLMKMLPSEHPFQHALVGKMTSTFWKTRTRTKNDRAGLKATRGLAQAQPGRPEGCPGRAPTLEPQKSPGPRLRSEGRARAGCGRKGVRPHGTLRLARPARRAPPHNPRGIRSGGRAG